MDNLTIKENLRKIRNSRKLTQEDMANGLDISLTAYRDIETGRTQIIKVNLGRIAEILDTSVEEILLGYSPVPKESAHLEEVQAEYGGKIRIYEDRMAELERRITDLEKIISTQDEVIGTKNEVIIMLKKHLDGDK